MAIDAKQLIAGWSSPADDLQITGERSEPDTDFVLALQSAGAEILASLPTGSDRLRLSQEVEAGDSGGAAAALARLEEQRPAPLTISPAPGGVTIRTWIVLDGLTKHSLLSTIGEMARTREAVLRVLGGAAETGGVASSAAQDQSAAATPAAAGAAAGATAGGAGQGAAWGAYPQSGYPGSGGYSGAGPVGPLSGSGQGYGQYGGQAATQGPWTPGHKVPPQGMQAWAVPDPNSPVIANLGGHLPVQVTEMRGAWARVVCSNGWTGWVDGRLLVAGP